MSDHLAGTHPDALDLSVVLPAYNEISMLATTVSNLIAGLSARVERYEIIIVENGSSDGTLQMARRLAEELPAVRVFTQPVGNYGAALLEGITSAKGRRIATFDVDYYDLSFLAEALETMDRSGAGIVLASKRAPGAADERPLLRRILTLGFTTILRKSVGLGVSDAHGMKVLDRAAIVPVAESTVLRDSLFDVEMVIRAQRQGILVEELPASVKELRPARTPVAARAIRALRDIVRLRRILGSSSS